MAKLPVFLNLIACTFMAVAGFSIPTFAGPRVANKSELKARVKNLYGLLPSPTSEQLRPIYAPFVSECMPTDEELMDEFTPGPKVLSWKIADIEYDPTYVGHDFKCECPDHEPHHYHVDCGAIVTIFQRDQDDQGKPQSGELYQTWVHISGTWYFAGVE